MQIIWDDPISAKVDRMILEGSEAGLEPKEIYLSATEHSQLLREKHPDYRMCTWGSGIYDTYAWPIGQYKGIYVYLEKP